MPKIILPRGVARLAVPSWEDAPHILEVEEQLLRLARGDMRKLIVSIPIRHGKSQLTTSFIAWLLISDPTLRILRVMASATTCEMMALEVMGLIERYGAVLTGVELDKRKAAASYFKTTAGGCLRSVGAGGDVESWSFDWIIIDDFMVDPYEIRSPDRRDQCFKDLNTKFFSRVNPTGRTKYLFIGSRRHPDDIQGRLLEASKSAPPEERWVYHHRQAIADENTPEERALWPTSREFNLEGLRRIRDEKITNGVAWEWGALFQNDPLGSPDTLAFDPAWFTEDMFYSGPTPEARYRILCIDPSQGKGSKLNDFFSATMLRIADDATTYVDDAFLRVCKADVAVDACVELIARNRDLDLVVVEANAGGIYVAELIERACKSRGLRCPIVTHTFTSKDNKEERITLNLFELLTRKKLKLRDTPANRLGFRQLRAFPTDHDDYPDSITLGLITLKNILTPERSR